VRRSLRCLVAEVGVGVGPFGGEGAVEAFGPGLRGAPGIPTIRLKGRITPAAPATRAGPWY
jgi:hypothetical protein